MASGNPAPAPPVIRDLLSDVVPAGAQPSSSTSAAAAGAEAAAAATAGAPAPGLSVGKERGSLGVMSRRSAAATGFRTSFQKKKAATVGVSERSLTAGPTTTAHEVSRKHLVSYTQLAQTLKELAGTTEQKRQLPLVAVVFPKLAVYNAVDPSLASPILRLLQTSSDAAILRFCYLFAARILNESSPAGGDWGGVPAPTFDAFADLAEDGSPAVTRAQVVPLLVQSLVADASNVDAAFHGRRMAALKALTAVPLTYDEGFSALVQLIFSILDAVTEGGKRRRRWSRLLHRASTTKDAAMKSNLHYAALSALRRLPLDAANETLLERIVMGIGCADAVGVRHALAMAVEVAKQNPMAVAESLARLAGGSMAAAIRIGDVFARVYLARLCGTLIHSTQIYDRADFRGLFSAFLFQLLYDANARVCLEAILCIVGTTSTRQEANPDQRADGWQILTTSVMDTRGAYQLPKDKAAAASAAAKETMPQPPSFDLVLKVVVHRIDFALRSPSRPMLHAALRVVAEIGKARAAALGIGLFTETPDDPQTDALDFQEAMGKVAPREKLTVDALLGVVMEAVRCVVACESVYVRAEALKAMIWMQSQYESVEELRATLMGELLDTDWTAPLLNDLLVTLHARFKATPEMAVAILDLAALFILRVPSKVDTATLQALWKTCLVGCGPSGKHLALEAVSGILDLPPPPPPPLPSMRAALGGKGEGVKVDGAKVEVPAWQGGVSDAQSAVALERIKQAAIWFLGENANYAAAEYAWESAAPPGSALMLLDAERMVAAAGVRNPTLAAAIARLQRCATNTSWEERVVAAYALMTVALRSGEPYRLQIYEFFHALTYGGTLTRKLRGLSLGTSNVEEGGASGTGLASVVGPMLFVLDEMYRAQDKMMNNIRKHEFSNEEWQDEELEQIFESHERLIDLALLFCFVPRSKYLPLGPISKRFVVQFHDRRGVDINTGRNDAALKESLQKLLSHTGAALRETSAADFPPITLLEPLQDLPATSLDAGAAQFLGLAGSVPPDSLPTPRHSMRFDGLASNFDEVYASALLETEDDAESELSVGSDSPTPSTAAEAFGNIRNWDEESLSGANVSGELNRNSAFSAFSGFGRDSRPSEQQYSEADEAAEIEQYHLKRQSENTGPLQSGKASYAFVAGDEDELSLQVGDEIEIEYEADGWYFARKKVPGPDGKASGFVPVLYVNTR